MNKDEIKNLIPHREPMLLIDEVAMTGETTAQGSYTITGEEWFLKGHFPGNPVVPGVILCEMMAQACCILLSEIINGRTPYLTGINNVKIKNKVQPGETLVIKCSLTKSKAPFYFANSSGYVNGKLCISGDFSFALIG